MASDKQIEANRRNAQKSTGAKTEEGKQRSSQNAITHGIFANELLITEDSETAEQHASKLAAYIERFQPQDEFELDLVEELAATKIRLKQCRKSMTGLLNATREREFANQTYCDPTGAIYHKFDSANFGPGKEDHVNAMLLGHSWGKVSKEVDLLTRYENRLTNRLLKLADRLETMKSTREKPESAGESASQSEPRPKGAVALQPEPPANEQLPSTPREEPVARKNEAISESPGAPETGNPAPTTPATEPLNVPLEPELRS